MSARRTPQWLAEYQARRRFAKVTGLETVSAPRPNKFHAKKTEVDNIVFDSKREATRYQDLKLREQLGLIHDLKLQVKYEFVVNGYKIGSYTSDFEYEEDSAHIVEDCKGYRQRDYIWRRKLMLALHNIVIRET